jgi:hypothetical protein
MDVGSTGVPIEAVIAGYNMDYTKDGDKRRYAYKVHQAALFSNLFVIKNYYEKKFYDNTGTEKSCTIYVVDEYTTSAHTTFVKTRIFIKGYYTPSNGYDNSVYGNAVRARGILTPTQLTDAYAYGYLRATDPNNFVDGDSVTISDITHSVNVVYRFVDTLETAYDILIGSDVYHSFNYLKAAINHEDGEGTLYGTGTAIHTDVHADVNIGLGNTSYLHLWANVGGVPADPIYTNSNNVNIVWDETSLIGGIDMVNFTDGDTITIGTQVYRFKNTMAQAYDVHIETTTLATLINFIDALNANPLTVTTAYYTGTLVNADVTCEIDYSTGVITLTSKLLGTVANTVVTSDTSGAVDFGADTLEGGAGEETGSAAFTTDLVELTENITATTTGWEYNANGWTNFLNYNFRVPKANFSGTIYTNNYYKGWFVNNGTDIWAFCEASSSDTTYIYFKINFADNVGQSYFGFSRFAVGFEGLSIFTTQREYSFSDFPNGIKIYPAGERILNLQFIKDRTGIQKQVLSEVEYSTAHTGYIDSYQYRGIDEAKYQFQIYAVPLIGSSFYSVTAYFKKVGAYDYFLFYNKLRDGNADISDIFNQVGWFDTGKLYVNCNSTAKVSEIISGEIITFNINLQAINKWDGFYFDYDCPEILSKKWYNLINNSNTVPGRSTEFKELGVWFNMDSVTENATGSTDFNAFYSWVMQIDGFQNLFLFNAVTLKGTNDLKRIGIKMYLKPYFNRRITSLVQFFSREVDTLFSSNTNHDNEISPTLMLNDSAPGRIVFANSGFIYENSVSQYYIDGVKSTNTHAELDNWNTGITLNSFLNQTYYKEQSMKCQGGCEIGTRNTIVYGISSDIAIADEDLKVGKTSVIGECSVAVSNVQNVGSYTHSIFSSERFFELANSKIIDVVSTTENQFLIFTKDTIKWMDFTDFGAGTWQEIGTFRDYGTTSKTAIAKITFIENAGMGTASWEFGKKEFGGVFFANLESIYCFNNNTPEDVLKGVWKLYYQSLVKTYGLPVLSYYPDKKEVWARINTTVYIYSMIEKNWKIYTFTDTPDVFHHNSDGQITWSNTGVIYRMTNELDSDNYLDKGSVGIPFDWKFRVNHNNPDILKLLHRIDLFYEMVTTYSGGYTAGTCKIAVGTDKNSGNVLNTTYTLEEAGATQTGYHLRVPIVKRILGNYYYIEFYSDSTTVANIISFKINQLSLLAKMTKGTLTKN